MKKRVALMACGWMMLVALFPPSLAAAGGPTPDGAVQLSYIANFGFLVSVNGKKVLIDGFFRGFDGHYQVPSEIIEKARAAQPPFDGIDLILVTHVHDDHYERSIIRQHLLNNPKAILASTPTVASELRSLGKQAVAFHAEIGKPDLKQFGDIRVEAHLLPHGSPGPGVVDNYAYVVSIGGVSFLHTGDADLDYFSFEQFRAFNFPEKKLDFAMINHWYLSQAGIYGQKLREGIAARYYLAGHYSYSDPPYRRAAVLEAFPDAIVFEQELDSWTIPATNPIAQVIHP